MPQLTVYEADNLAVLAAMPAGSVDLIYIDPPFNTGTRQERARFRAIRDDGGARRGFQGRAYRAEPCESHGFDDSFDDFLAFIGARIREAHRILAPHGSFFFHLDYREIHYCKVFIDSVFGRRSFINEIIWAYDYGARSRKKWSAKHDTILWYAKDPERYTFNYAEVDRIPYMAPGMVGAEKAARGKTPTDVWWHTIVSPTGKEKTGYATQKPLGIVSRIVRVHSNPGDTLCDFFAGSGTLGEAAYTLGRHCILVDENPEAVAVMRRRFGRFPAGDVRFVRPGAAQAGATK